jgi:RNA polymerase sigma factor (sigma-70 family)
METKHKIYGRVRVIGDINDSSPLVEVQLLNPRDNLPKRITVGKSALADHGEYIPKKRGVELAEQYLPLAYAGAGKSYKTGDDFDELLSVASLALCEAAARFDGSRNNGFAAFAKVWISGELLKHKNPERNGTMNIVDNADLFMEYIGQGGDSEKDLMIARVYAAFDELTPKQQYVMRGLYELGLTQEQVADRMGISQKNVNNLVERATVAIRKHLGLNVAENEKVCG